MYHFDEPRVRKTGCCDLGAALPSAFAAVPVDVATGGSYVVRGLSTGRVLHHRSALSLAIGLDLEWNRQLRDIVIFDDLLADGGPSWAERMAYRLDAEHAPDLLVRVDLCGSISEQAVSFGRVAAPAERREDAAAVSRMREGYRDRGVVWGMVTEANVCPTRASTLLWLSVCAQMAVPKVVKDAVAREVVLARGELALATIILRAALHAGVDTPTAVAALGQLIAIRELDVDVDGGAILTGMPLVAASCCHPEDLRASWKHAMRRHHPRQRLVAGI